MNGWVITCALLSIGLFLVAPRAGARGGSERTCDIIAVILAVAAGLLFK